MSTNWIKDSSVLSNCLQHLNSIQEKNNPIDRYRSMFEGLNQLYKEYYYHKNLVNIQNNHRAEKKSFKQLVKENLESNEKHSLINSREFTDFLEIDPTIMDEEIRRKHPAYNPRTITDDVRECASKYHIQLKKAFEDFKINNCKLDFVLETMCNVLYVVRSNLAHGEKTPEGPDIDKAARDLYVCKNSLPLLDLIISFLLGYPEKKLAVYGTLKPRGINSEILKDLNIIPYKGFVEGLVYEKNNFLFFNWQLNNKKTEVFIYEPISRNKISELDKFEGIKFYKRIFVPIETESKSIIVSNIYVENKTGII